jgi:hypothetical protein
MTEWKRVSYVGRRMWMPALCVSFLAGCPSGDITLPGLNQEPTANAGADRTIDVGQRVTLDALGSTDADDDALTFSWQQRSGPAVTLDGANTAQPSFLPAEDGFYEFALTVTDGRGGSDTSVVRVFVGDVDPASCPRANAGTAQTVSEGAIVRLFGRNSADPNGRPLTFDWFQLSGPPASIEGVFTAEPSFTAPSASGGDIMLEFELTVRNEQGCADRDTVVVTVRDRDRGDSCDGIVCEDDGLFCNGVESCSGGFCVSSGSPCGAGEACDEAADTCTPTSTLDCTTDSDCDDGIYCNGEEACQNGDCVSSGTPCAAGETCNEQDASCTPIVQSNEAFGIVVTTSPNPARVGETLDVEITVTNPGAFDRNDVVLTLEYPDGLDALRDTMFDGACGGNRWCERFERATFNIGMLVGGKGRTFSLPIQVASDTADGTIIVFETMVSDATGDQMTSTSSLTVDSTRNLELALAEDRDPVSSGGMIVYTITYGLRSTGNGVLDGVLSLPIPAGTTFVSATGGGTMNGNVVQWSLGAVGPGQSGEVKVTVQVNNLGEGSIVEAEATLEDTAAPGNRVRYQAATRVLNDIPLELVVVTGTGPVRPGETMDVEFTVTNAGAFDRTGVFLALEYPDGLNALRDTLFDGACGGNRWCERQERAWFDIGTLASGEGRTFSMPIQAAEVSDGFIVTFEAEVSASNGDRLETGSSFAVSRIREFELTLVENLDPVPSDGTLVYTLTYGLLETSSGVPEVALSMPLPDGVGLVSATDGGTLVGNVVHWSLGPIGPGQTGEVQVTVQVENLREGSIIAAEATLEDTASPANHARCKSATRVRNNIPLELVVVTIPNPAMPSDTLAVEFTITNTGVFDRTDVFLALEYPDGLDALRDSSFDGACGGNRWCERTERAWFNIGTIAAGDDVFFRMRPVVGSGALEGKLIRFDAYVTDSTGSQVIETDVLRVSQ